MVAFGIVLALAVGLAPAGVNAQPVQLPTADPVPAPPLPVCAAQIDPIPSGLLGRPPDVFNEAEYAFVHSSIELQGEPATEKWASGLLYLPTTPALFTGFSSAVAVNNPDPATGVNVTIEYRDENGNLLSTPTFVFLAPNGTYAEGATKLLDPASTTPGRGVARVLANHPIVGATLLHVGQIGGVGDPDPFTPGAASAQQLQVIQDGKTDLYWGPIPVSTIEAHDFLNGILPFFWVANPTAFSNTVTIDIRSRGGIVFPPAVVTIPPFGTHFDLTLWNVLVGFYTASPPPAGFDDDFLVHVTSTSGLPIVGDGVMTDFFGNGGAANLQAGTRFRMGSTMMANSPALKLVDPELTSQDTSLKVETLIGIYNAGTVDVGPVRIQYFNRNGGSIGVDSVTSLPPNGVVRIGAGLPASLNYPTSAIWDGWARITACKKGLVGWTMREVSNGSHGSITHFNKVYGEELQGENGLEPGAGKGYTVAGNAVIRKSSPLVRVDPSWYWPGYEATVNAASANLGPYWYRFYNFGGFDLTLLTAQPYAGLPWARTSFTYEDQLINPALLFSAATISGQVDITQTRIEGIDVLGDPFIEWGIPGFPGEP